MKCTHADSGGEMIDKKALISSIFCDKWEFVVKHSKVLKFFDEEKMKPVFKSNNFFLVPSEAA